MNSKSKERGYSTCACSYFRLKWCSRNGYFFIFL